MECNEQQELCSVYPGDSISYDLTFEWDDGTPIDVTGMTIWYTAKLNPTDAEGLAHNIQVSHVFPVGSDSAIGIGVVTVPSEKTKGLIPGRHMRYDFVLVDGSAITTVGAGSFVVLQNVMINKR